jgi:tetratricopeptide (TPR) repeat protein
LKIISFFDPESIPLDMIMQGAEALLGSLSASIATSSNRMAPGNILFLLRRILLRQTKQKQSETMDVMDYPQLKPLLHLILSPVQLQDAITQLQNRCLVKHVRSADTSVLYIHDLIRIMVQASLMDSGIDREWFAIAVELTCGAFRLVEDPESYKCWSQCAIFTPHFHLLTMWDEMYGSRSIPIMEANVKIARYLWSTGRYIEAETLFRRTLAVSEERLGLEHPDTLGIMHWLGTVYRAQGRYDEAEIQYKHVLALRKKRGSNHPDTVHTMHSLALVYDSQGRHSEAERQYKHVLALTKKQLGLEHPDTLRTMHNLANVCYSRGQHSEAETLHKHVLVLREKQLGPDHPHTLNTMHNLALVYNSQGRHSEAETQYKHVLALTEKQLGLQHPDTLRIMYNLALAYNSQGRHNEAEILLKRVIVLREKQLGVEHPDTLRAMHGLACVYDSQGRHSEAETQYKHVLALTEERLGVEHPDTLLIMQNLALLYESLGRHSEAEI